MKLDSVKKLAKEMSLLSDHHTFKLGCILFKGKRVVSKGTNWIKKTHPLYSTGQNWLRPLHAEASAILAARHYDLTGTSLLVYREASDGTPATAKPCENCMKLIKTYGIKTIIYSDNELGWISEKV